MLRVGDRLITPNLKEEPITTIERIPGKVRTASITVPGTNTYLANGAWTHNDLAKAPITSLGGLSGAGSSGGGSGSGSGGKSSGSSFNSSSGIQPATSVVGLSTLA